MIFGTDAADMILISLDFADNGDMAVAGGVNNDTNYYAPGFTGPRPILMVVDHTSAFKIAKIFISAPQNYIITAQYSYDQSRIIILLDQ